MMGNSTNTMTPQEAWSCAQMQLQLQLDRPSYDVWIAGTRLLSYDPATAQVVMSASNSTALEMLQKRYDRNIKNVLSNILFQDNLTITYQQVEQPPAPAPAHDPDDIPLFRYLSNPPERAQAVASTWIKPIPPLTLTPPAWISTPPAVAPESTAIALPAPATWEQAITQAAVQAGVKSYDPVSWACNKLAGSAGPILRFLLFRWNIRPSWTASKSRIEMEVGLTPTQAMLKKLREAGVVVVKTRNGNSYTSSDQLENALSNLFSGHFCTPNVLKSHVYSAKTPHRNLESIDRHLSLDSLENSFSLETQLIQLGVNAQRAKVFAMSIPPQEIAAIIARAGQQTGVERIGGYLYTSLANAMKAQQRKTA